MADLLEGEPEDGDVFAADGVKHGADHHFHESLLLVVVHLGAGRRAGGSRRTQHMGVQALEHGS